ncbi:MAG: hypothetical protein MK116_04580 [Phycisphaerales bacterium]|nr:hypothetical protein [Phycisphaerales bacterium]
MNFAARLLTIMTPCLAGLPILASCAAPVGWGTDVTATSLNEDQWKVEVVITKHPNEKHGTDQVVSAPTLICRGGESAEMRIGDGQDDMDLVRVQVDTAKDPATDEMTFMVVVREGGWLRSRTSFKVQPDDAANATTAMAGDSGAK